MGLWVEKFGGTSVADPERIRNAAQLISRTVSEGHRVAVVVSAMGGSTDDLLSLAQQITGNPMHREMDMLLSAGERISMALLSMALSDLKIDAISFTGSQAGLITDGNHRRARILRILGDRVRDALADQKVAIVAGFQGVSEDREVTTLGRGGSDTTAVALAAALDADGCRIYTDVEGVMTGDPSRIKETRCHPGLNYSQMLEVASLGAGVLHPRSVDLAWKYGISLEVMDSGTGERGTVVGSSEKMEEQEFVGVTSCPEKMLIRVELARASVLGALWQEVGEQGLEVLCPQFEGPQVRFYGDREDEQEWSARLDTLVQDGYLKGFQMDRDVIPVSVVGKGFGGGEGALLKVFDLLSQKSIPVVLGVSGSQSVTVGIRSSYEQEALEALHGTLRSLTK